MQVKNKLEKFLISLSGFFALVLVILGFKVQDDTKKIAMLANVPAPDPQADPGLAVQDIIKSDRDKKLNAASHAPLTDSNTQTTIKTVIPGKTITQTIPATSSSKSSSSSSSSSKKTKTS